MKLAFCILAVFGCTSAQFRFTTQNEILKIHNDLRSTVAKGNLRVNGTLLPSAANMRKMKWDSSLAVSAQTVANECPESSLGDSLFGENIYSNYTEFSNTLDDMGVEAAKMWKSMFKDYNGTSIKMDEATMKSGITRATQMAWATTEFIGCGVKKCGSDPFLQVYKFSVVCHYREKGNILNSNIYEEGEACSACPILTLCEEASGLCV